MDQVWHIKEAKSKYFGFWITLLNEYQLSWLKKNFPTFVLIDIFGEECQVKDCDIDTRFGYVAFGTLNIPVS